MIAYHILCHDNFPQVARLIESLYTPSDVFLIDIDDGKNPNTRAIDKWTSRENVHVKRDANIGWGASGTLRKTIRCFQMAQKNELTLFVVALPNM